MKKKKQIALIEEYKTKLADREKELINFALERLDIIRTRRKSTVTIIQVRKLETAVWGTSIQIDELKNFIKYLQDDLDFSVGKS